MLKFSHALRPRGRVGWGGVGLGKGGLWVNALGQKYIVRSALRSTQLVFEFRPTL